jgi:ApaG protein
MSDSEKYQVSVRAVARFLPEQSSPEGNQFVFAYRVTIRNTGSITVQLVSRHWIITDAANKVQEVRGLGVIGEQPTLKPGESHEYSSGSSLATPVGTMRGSYQMLAEDGTKFEAPIPEFVLSVPNALH